MAGIKVSLVHFFLFRFQSELNIPQNPVELPQNPVELHQIPVELHQNPVELHQNPVEWLEILDFSLQFHSNFCTKIAVEYVES